MVFVEQFQPSSGDESLPRYILKIGTTAECVVQTVDLLLYVGTDKGRLVMFNLNLLDEGRCCGSVSFVASIGLVTV